MSAIVIITVVQIMGVVLLGIFMAKFRMWKPKRTFYFVMVYVLCGLVAFTYLSVAAKDMGKSQSKDVIREQQLANKEMTERLKMRDFSILQEAHLKFTKTFEPTAEDITVNRDGEQHPIYTVINWVDSMDSEITVSYYETPIYTKRIDMTPYIKLPAITFENNTIFIHDSESRLKMKTINLSLEMLDPNRWRDGAAGIVGNRILYLNVPKHFNIIDSSGWY